MNNKIRSTSTSSSRRKFIKNTGIATMGFMGLSHFVNPAFAKRTAMINGYGPLLADPKGILNLPKGFSYNIISKKGDRMDDGFLVPARADGMGTFSGKDGKVILIRNHENNPDDPLDGAFGPGNELLKQADLEMFYEFGKGSLPALGGTTTLVYDPHTRKVVNQYLSLAGTVRNCAGGVTPWNSWLSCEESTLSRGAYDGKFEKDHGYVFEVPASEGISVAEPVPLRACLSFRGIE